MRCSLALSGLADGRADAGMQSALPRLGLFPPPATGALVFSGEDGSRAGCAPDTGELLVMQRIVGNLAGADVLPDLLLGPLQQRADLVQVVRRIPLDGLPQ